VHIAIGHYGAYRDVSGVTTWLTGLISEARSKGHSLDLMIHHFGENPDGGSFVKENGAHAAFLTAKSKPRWTEDAVHQTIDFLNAGRPQVFLPQCLAGFHFAARFCEQHGLPWVFTVHSDDPVYWGLLEECAPKSSLGAVVVVSDYLNREVRRRGLPLDPITIPYGVPVPGFYARFDRNPFRVVFSGRVVELQKRISLVLQAMATVCHANASVECLILGDGSDLEASRRWVREQGLSERIRFTGSLKHADAIQRLSECQAFLLMSDYEGLPVALLEAMACGVVPVVRSIQSGISQLVKPGETGFLTSDDPDEAANVILTLAQNSDLWTKLSMNARSFVSREYEARACYEKWLSVLDTLARTGSPQFPIPNRRIYLPSVNPKLIEVDTRRPKGRQWISFLHRGLRRRVRGALFE
jgi:colanic acid/amylovoran biosynthesis glycosyltransferase